MDKESGKRKCIWDGIKITRRGADTIVFVLSLAVMVLILYAIVISV